ncbi:MAG: tryptophan synthase subunit alpha [Actinomycetota bacterium]
MTAGVGLESALRARRDRGGRALVPYVTAGLPGVDAALLRELEGAGADAIEIGIPFSDPVMDGGVIQQASQLALEAGTHPRDAFALAAEASLGIPIAVMTYVNPVFRIGYEAFLREAVGSGIRATIVPDLPVDEAETWVRASEAAGSEPVFLAAPGEPAERLKRTVELARGFVYCVSSYGVTGARSDLSDTAREVVEGLRPLTDLPLLVGVGITTPGHARQAGGFSDGVIVGSAIVRRLVEGDREGAVALARELRAALPTG